MSRSQWTKQVVDNHVSNILKQQKDEKQVSYEIKSTEKLHVKMVWPKIRLSLKLSARTVLKILVL